MMLSRKMLSEHICKLKVSDKRSHRQQNAKETYSNPQVFAISLTVETLLLVNRSQDNGCPFWRPMAQSERRIGKLVKVRARELEPSSIPAFLDLDKRTHI
jgi:hypothetical protein